MKEENDEVTLKETPAVDSRKSKSIGLLEALSLTFGLMTGSGIFISVGATFGVFQSQSIGMVIVFWVLGGLVALLGGLCYAELGTRIPESGGDRAYYAKVFNRQLSKTYVYVYIFLVKAITLAAQSVIAGSYLTNIFYNDSKDHQIVVKLLAASTLILCFTFNSWSKKISNKTTVIITVFKIVTLLMIVIMGIYMISTKHVPEWDRPFNVTGFDYKQLFPCLVNLFWSYEGWNSIGMVAGDMKNPTRDLPISMVSAVILVIVLNVLVVISYSAILGFDVVRVSETVATGVGVKMLKKAYPVLPSLIFLSTLGSANSHLYTASCVIVSAGYNGQLPRIFSLVHHKSRTPIIALLIELLLSLIFILFKFQILLTYSSFISWTFYFTSLCCLIKIKLIDKTEPKGKIFRIPIIFVFPMQIVCVLTVFICFYMSPVGCGVFSGIVVAAFAYQYIPKQYKKYHVLQTAHERVCAFLIGNLGLDFANSRDIT